MSQTTNPAPGIKTAAVVATLLGIGIGLIVSAYQTLNRSDMVRNGENLSVSGGVLSGHWKLGFFDTNDHPVVGQVSIVQDGTSFRGSGEDEGIGQFQLLGTLEYPKVSFYKQYLKDGKPLGKPVLYSGEINYVNPNPDTANQQVYVHALGSWQLSMREGNGWRHTVKTYSNQWEAIKTSLATSSQELRSQIIGCGLSRASSIGCGTKGSMVALIGVLIGSILIVGSVGLSVLYGAWLVGRLVIGSASRLPLPPVL